MRDLLAHLLLRCPQMAQFVRRLPVLGAVAHRVGSRLLPPGARVWAKVRAGPARGLWLRVDPRYEDEYIRSTHEPLLQQFLTNHLRPGMVFYDVGAHIGFFSLLAARLVGREGKVFSFEAAPENVNRLMENARRNGFEQITIVPAAVWKECRQLRFQRASDDSSRNTGRVVLTQAAAPELIEVEAVTLDHFAQQHLFPQVIKIDVEGAEVEVLEGAQKILAAEPPVLLCEVHSAESAIRVQQLLDVQGYRVEWFEPTLRYPQHLLAVSC